MATNSLYGLVLAGGRSRRMGHDKALLQRGDKSQLAHVVSILEECVERVFVSARAEQENEAERRQFEQIVDRYEDLGPVAGILSALESHPTSDWLVVACDLPNIDVETLRYLLQERQDTYPFTAYISTHDGLPEPLCAVYRATCLELVRGFVDSGIHCPRKILIRSETQLLRQLKPDSLDNVNTPDDLGNSVLQVAS